MFQCLDLNLETMLRQQVSEVTQIWGHNGCIAKLEEIFKISYPLHARRYDFHATNQDRGQVFSDFYAKLKQKGDEADLANMTIDDIYVFRILMGTTDQELLKRFMKLKEPTLKDILKEGEDYEIYMRNQKMTAGPTMATVAAVMQQSLTQDQALALYKSLKGKCMGCGKPKHETRQACSQYGKTCSKCQKLNHGSWCCLGPQFKAPRPPRREESVKQVATPPQPTAPPAVTAKQVLEEVFSVQCNMVTSNPSKPTPKAQVLIADEQGRRQFTYKATPDTGATRSIISADVIAQHGLADMIWKGQNIRLRAANGTYLKCLGNIILTMKSATRSEAAFVDAIVTSDMHDEMLISWHDLMNLGILPPGWPDQQQPAVPTEANTAASVVQVVTADELSHEFEKLKVKYKDVLGTTLSEANNAMTGQPVVIPQFPNHRVRPLKRYTTKAVPIHMQDAARKLVKELQEAGIIVPVSQPTEWCSPAHFVPKPNGKVRLVTDYTVLNKTINRPVHPFLSAKDLMLRIKPTSKVFAKVDAIHGYFQIPLAKQSSLLTTFLLDSGRYRYTACPMGLSCSSDFFCRKN